ncbi:heavy metal translocating P-type ATPase [Bartonella apihabitans]|nr:heavy metal translocating P-type ATPase [Bartonella apihabitans]WLT08989.1 heavy metal translocating P-type ATPase [Bartonella apihabitans]
MAEVEKETIPHGHDHQKNSATEAGYDDKHHEIISLPIEAAQCRAEAKPASENEKEHDHEHHLNAGHHHDEHHEHAHDHCSADHCHDHSHEHHNHSHEHDDEDEEIVDDDPRLEAGNDSLWRVEGMDCAACARTITTALERMSGVENVHVSLTRERLSLKADKSRVSPEEIEKTVASLGYRLHKIDNDQPREQQEEKYWYQTQKGQAAILSGVLLALAYIASAFLPHFSFWFFTIAALAALLPVAKRAFAALKNGSPFTIEMLMTIAAIGAIFINATQEAAVVVFLFCVGEVLEGVATGHARAGIKSLSKLAPKTAWKEVDGKLEEVPAESLRISDIVLARPGDRLPADGVVIEGTSGVDESPITGESIPVTKTINSKVFAGSINNESTLRIRVETKPSDNTIARIISLVEEAQDAKAPTERFIDAFSKIYMPIIVGIAILVAIIPPLFDGQWREWNLSRIGSIIDRLPLCACYFCSGGHCIRTFNRHPSWSSCEGRKRRRDFIEG